MLRYPVLLLDYDGTLAETRPAILRSLQEAFKELGVTPPSQEYLGTQLGKGGTLKDFYKVMVEQSSAEDAQRYVDAYRRCYIQADDEETFLYEGTHEVLRELRQRGYRLIALSNKHGPTLLRSLKRFQLEEFFEGALGAEDNLPRKPQKEVLTQRVAPLCPAVPPEHFLMVGDTTADLNFAANTGLDVCWAAYGHGAPHVCEALNPTYCINALPELLGVLASTEG